MSLFSKIDTPVVPQNKGLSKIINGVTEEQRNNFRQRLVDTTKEVILLEFKCQNTLCRSLSVFLYSLLSEYLFPYRLVSVREELRTTVCSQHAMLSHYMKKLLYFLIDMKLHSNLDRNTAWKVRYIFTLA